MKINTIQCKTLLTKSRLPKAKYCINPYIGCLHACVYCYARFMRRFTSHDEPWGHFLDVKINAPEVLARELARKPKRGVVLLGSVTDAYQPVEQKYRLTRAILEILLQHDFPVSVLTKSNLVVRDLDLFKQFSKCEIGLTVTTTNQEIARNFEPHSSTPQQRIRALGTLHRSGITTYAFIGPILPELTDLETIFVAIQGKVNFIMAESLNMKCGNWQDIQDVLKKKYPHYLSLYQSGFDKKYWNKIEEQLRALSKEFNIPLRGFYRH
jgi:DNA repair photolyase